MTIDFDKIFEFLNSLGGMPAASLVFLLCLGAGFILKKSPVIHNSSVPLLVVMIGAIALPLLSDFQSSQLSSSRVYYTRQTIVGFLCGTAAWLCHRWLLKPLLAKFGIKEDDNGNTVTFTKTNEKTPTTQPTDPKP